MPSAKQTCATDYWSFRWPPVHGSKRGEREKAANCWQFAIQCGGLVSEAEIFFDIHAVIIVPPRPPSPVVVALRFDDIFGQQA